VITGAPCSGKTTVINKLAELDLQVVSEVARGYIEEKKNEGVCANVLRSDEASFQEAVLRKKILVEKEIIPQKNVFFDRGVPDSITYFRMCGIDPNKALSSCYHYRYKNVFILNQLTFVNDYARLENEKEADLLWRWLLSDYEYLGYNLTQVPVMSVEERVDMILEMIK